MLVQMFIVLMFQTCAQYSLELWKLARYNSIAYGSPFDALYATTFVYVYEDTTDLHIHI